MHETESSPARFASVDDALAAAADGLAFVANADAGSLPIATIADTLRALERAESVHTAARAVMMSAFSSRGGYELDGQQGMRSWLFWQTRVTFGAASGAMGWMRRLSGHPQAAAALAAGLISGSWARMICAWVERLPEANQADAERILLTAAASGADLGDLEGLFEEMLRRVAPPDDDGDGDGGFGDRDVQLALHYKGAGQLTGNLTPECAAAFTAMLESLGKRTGPEDDRTQGQRHHDALEDACQQLAAAKSLPDRAGQPTQVQLHVTLDQLRSLGGAADAEAAWLAGRAGSDGEPGWLSSRAAAEAYACDAQIVPIVSGHLDPAALAAMTREFLRGCPLPGQALPASITGHGQPAGTAGSTAPGTRQPGTGTASPGHPGTGTASPGHPGCTCGGCTCRREQITGPGSFGPGRPDESALPPRTMRRLQDTLLRYAADVLSGPAGLAAFLRTSLLAAEFPASVSLPLETGMPANTVPPHLRRAVIARDRHCAFAGCRRRPADCHAHHLIPRSQGGQTTLSNVILLCPYHHLVVIHRLGWTITLNADGTTTATSPDRTRTLHSHGPPATAAA